MPDVVHRLDVIHEARFAEPAFDLAREFPRVLKKYYEALAPRYAPKSEHISVNAAGVLSELVVRIGLFNNTASIELRPDRMSVRLTNVNNSESVEIAKAVLLLSHEALESSLPETKLKESSLITNVWIEMEGGAQAADLLLSRNTVPAIPLDPHSWGAETLRYTLRCQSRNETDGWAALLHAEPSIVEAAHLYLMIQFDFQHKILPSISKQIVLSENVFRSLAKAIGLNLPLDESANA